MINQQSKKGDCFVRTFDKADSYEFGEEINDKILKNGTPKI